MDFNVEVVKEFFQNLVNDKKKLAIAIVVLILVLILIINGATKGSRDKAQVKEFRRAMSMLNQAVVIQNKITNSTFAGKNKQQIIDAFAARLRAVTKDENSFKLKNGVVYYVGDVNPACKADNSDKCADITVALKGKKNGKVSTLKKLNGRYAVELRATKVLPATDSDTANIIRKIR